MNMLRRVHHSQFLRHNAVFFVGALAVGALNYLYYPVLGRMLTPGTFGEVQTLVSLFLQLSVFLAALSLVVVNITNNTNDVARRNRLIFEIEKLALLLGLGVLAVTLLLGPQLQSLLRFTSPWPFAVLGLTLLVSVPFMLRLAFLRSKQLFGLVSTGNILSAGGKLVLSAALVVAGLGTIGAIGGILLAQIIACSVVVWWALGLGLKPPDGKRFGLPDMKLLAPELRYAGLVLAVSLAVTLQYSIDIIIVKHYFDAHTAGLYAGIAAVARILFFLTTSFTQVLISKVRMQDENGESRRTLYKSLGLIGLVSLPVLGIMVFFPNHIVGLLMGESYQTFAELLPKLGLSVFLVSLLNVLAAYYLIRRVFRIVIPIVGGAILTYLFILLHHGSLEAVVDSLLLGSAITLAASAWKLTERRHG
jgi:O-antigen/teichoic acid export membrane protein